MKPHRRRNRPAPAVKDTAPQKTVVQKVARALELPGDIAAGMAHIEMSGNREIVIDGCKNILEYDENVIKINAGKMTVRFCGRGLTLRNLSQDSAVIEGFVSSIEFLS